MLLQRGGKQPTTVNPRKARTQSRKKTVSAISRKTDERSVYNESDSISKQGSNVRGDLYTVVAVGGSGNMFQ